MPRKKQSPPSIGTRIVRLGGEFLVTLGTPSLFIFKILFWCFVWLGKITVESVKSLPTLGRQTTRWLQTRRKLVARATKRLAANLVKRGRHTQIALLAHKKKLDLLIAKAIGLKAKLGQYFTQLNLRLRMERIGTKTKHLWSPIKFAYQALTTLANRRPSSRKPSLPLANGSSLRTRLVYLGIGALICFTFVFIPFWVKSTLSELPSPLALTAREIPIATKIYDRSGILLYQFYADENRTLVALDSLPNYVVNATVAIEDRNFYRHVGFDPQGIVRAAIANSSGGQIVQGGSTITQQLIKSALLTPKQSIDRKLKEVFLSVWTERVYTKKQILEMYFNQVAYGGTAYGIKSAAQIYFNKEPKDLTLAEAALLAGLPSSPSNYSPFGPHPELSKERQLQVLNAMVNQGYITLDQAKVAQNEPLNFVSPETSIKAPHFVMYVKDYLTQKYGNRLVERGGLEVTTSLDYPLYEKVSKIIKEGVEKQGYLNVGNAASLVTIPQTGEVLAMVGSRDFFDISRDGNVNVTLSPRSPGSSIKPLTFALALEKGIYTPSSIISDTPTAFRIPGSAPYTPRNYDGKTSGNVTIRSALARSLNIPAVKVLEKVGVPAFIEFAQKLGITTFNDPNRFGLSLTLGGGEVLMTDMATAYSAFASGGEKVELKPVLLVKDYRGNTLEDNRQNSKKTRVLSSQTAFLISDILSDDSARAATFGRGSILNIPNQTVAVKTGTTDDKRDNWTIGYTPSYLAVVWVGNNDNSRMSQSLESGNTGAAAIWNPIFTTLLKDKPNQGFARPENIVAVSVCALNGLLPCSNCPLVRTEYFQKGTEPTKACNISKEDLDKPTN